MLEKDLTSFEIKLISTKTLMDLPDTFHFSAVLFEMQKQYYHGNRWYNQAIEQRKEELGFKFKKWRSAIYSDLELMAK
jgi:hypothetical protein